MFRSVKENFNSIRFLFRKSEIYDFFRLAKTGNDVELFVKARWCNANFRIIGDKLNVPHYLKTRLCVCGVYVYKNKRGNTNNERLGQSALAAACISNYITSGCTRHAFKSCKTEK